MPLEHVVQNNDLEEILFFIKWFSFGVILGWILDPLLKMLWFYMFSEKMMAEAFVKIDVNAHNNDSMFFIDTLYVEIIVGIWLSFVCFSFLKQFLLFLNVFGLFLKILSYVFEKISYNKFLFLVNRFLFKFVVNINMNKNIILFLVLLMMLYYIFGCW